MLMNSERETVRAPIQKLRFDHMRHSQDCYDWVLAVPDVSSLEELLDPEFWEIARDELRAGQMIEVRFGPADEGISRAWFNVLSVPRNADDGPIIMTVSEVTKFKPLGKVRERFVMKPMTAKDKKAGNNAAKNKAD